MASLQKDIYRGYKFTVSINSIQGQERNAFQKVTGMKASVEVVEYREGNMHDRMEKFAGMMSYDAVTLERGLSNDEDFKKWMKEVCDISQITDNVPTGGASDRGNASYRKDVVITLHDKTGTAVKRYTLLQAFPSEYTMGDFDATSNDVVITSLVLQHHGIREESP